jgi:SanA protein
MGWLARAGVSQREPEVPRPKRGKARAILLSSAVLTFLPSLFANLVIRQQTSERIFFHARDISARPVAIVLGAAVRPGGKPSDALRDRLEAALSLYRLGRVSQILVSGDGQQRSHDEVGVMRSYLQTHGVPESAVREDPLGLRTLDSMTRAKALFGVSRAVVCTQAFHLPRSLYLARASGIDAVGLVSDQRVYRGAIYNGLREWFASTAAIIDVLLS